MTRRATARAYSNIAFIKYWGNADNHLRLPANSSLSMNLDGLYTDTTVTWIPELEQDMLTLNGIPEHGDRLQRVRTFLTLLRKYTGIAGFAKVESKNNFPMGAGIASSASAFAALSAAAVWAAGLNLSERVLTTLARLGSGSASRSIPAGFVEWLAGDTHENSFAQSFAKPEHWALVDVIAIVSETHKTITSQRGHHSANTSDLQQARVGGAAERFETCKKAILERDFATFAQVVEHDSNLMHAVMMTSQPPLFYWMPATLTIMSHVRLWREEGLPVCYTLDAGPNVHCICPEEVAEEVSKNLQTLSGITDIRVAKPGGPTHLLE